MPAALSATLATKRSTVSKNCRRPTKDSLNLPEARFMFVDTMLVFDHVTHKIKVLSYVKLNGDLEKGYRKAVAKIDDLVARLQQPYAAKKTAPHKVVRNPPLN